MSPMERSSIGKPILVIGIPFWLGNIAIEIQLLLNGIPIKEIQLPIKVPLRVPIEL